MYNALCGESNPSWYSNSSRDGFLIRYIRGFVTRFVVISSSANAVHATNTHTHTLPTFFDPFDN